jgi:1,2-diacylglycerol 3-alpha-glucosyltransferase
MASHSSPALRVEFGQVNELHPSTHNSKAPVDRKNDALARRGIDSQGKLLEVISEIPAFAELAARAGRPLKIAILSDFTRIPYANGAVFQTRFLYRALRRCGHQVTLVGPKDPNSAPGDVPEGTIELPSLPLAAYPGVQLPIPSEAWVYDADRFDFDLIFAQTTSPLVQFGLWLKQLRGTPVICVNTTHLTMAYEVLLPEALAAVPVVHKAVLGALAKPFEISYSAWYNASDGLVVLSEGLRQYWVDRGVTCPIHVVPRTVTPENFDRPIGEDPFLPLLRERGLADGPRLLCAGRHTREKSQDRLIRIFAKHVLPVEPTAVLAMVGIGPDTERYKAIAAELGVADRVIFTGERPFTEMLDFYAYADVFVHASLSETYGNVLGEALWCGCPTVAFVDGMGASSQVTHEENGFIVDPGKGLDGQIVGDIRFGTAVVKLLRDAELRARLGRAASKRARARHTPAAIERRMGEVFQSALDAGAARSKAGFEAPRGFARVAATAKSFVPWTASMVGLYLSGFLRPAGRKDWGSSQPTIG